MPSPTKLKASTVSAISNPGNQTIQGASSSRVSPFCSMLPRLACGG